MKHPVPKYKTPKRKTRQRHSSFVHHAKVRILGMVNLVDCPHCKQKKLSHHVCKNCGKHNGRQVLNMAKEVEKITKVKA